MSTSTLDTRISAILALVEALKQIVEDKAAVDAERFDQIESRLPPKKAARTRGGKS